MMKEVSTPNFGLNFLLIANEYSRQTKIKDKLAQAIKIDIFSVCAIEALANCEGMNILSGQDLDEFVRYGNLPGYNKKDKRPDVLKKWEYILNYYKFPIDKIAQHLQNIKKLNCDRNELIHFKPHKNQTEKILIPAKKKVVGPDGLLYTSFRKTGYKIIKKGVLNKISLTKARNNFNKINKLIFDFYTSKKTWPHPKFSNQYWKTKSPFWKYRNKYL